MLPSPAEISYFLEVANLLNLSRAAEVLGISQPSLTLAIQRLERNVGTPILIRHKRGVSLTKAGKQLLAYSRYLLEQWEAIKSETLASMQQVQGCITIGCHPSVGLYALPRFMANLLETHPLLEIKIEHDLSRKITEKVINLSIDIGIVVNPVKHPDLVIKKLDDDLFTLWRSKNWHSMQDLNASHPVIMCDPELVQTQSILKNLKKLGFQDFRLLTMDNLELIGELTKNGCGVGILPGSIANKIQLHPIPDMPTYPDEICLLYRGENRDVKAIQVISETIKNVF